MDAEPDIALSDVPDRTDPARAPHDAQAAVPDVRKPKVTSHRCTSRGSAYHEVDTLSRVWGEGAPLDNGCEGGTRLRDGAPPRPLLDRALYPQKRLSQEVP